MEKLHTQISRYRTLRTWVKVSISNLRSERRESPLTPVSFHLEKYNQRKWKSGSSSFYIGDSNLPNTVSLYYSSLSCGNPQPQRYFITTSWLLLIVMYICGIHDIKGVVTHRLRTGNKDCKTDFFVVWYNLRLFFEN